MKEFIEEAAAKDSGVLKYLSFTSMSWRAARSAAARVEVPITTALVIVFLIWNSYDRTVPQSARWMTWPAALCAVSWFTWSPKIKSAWDSQIPGSASVSHLRVGNLILAKEKQMESVRILNRNSSEFLGRLISLRCRLSIGARLIFYLVCLKSMLSLVSILF